MTNNMNNIDKPLCLILKTISEEIFGIGFNLEKLTALHMINDIYILKYLIQYVSGIAMF